MEVVAYPKVSETIQRAIADVFAPFFSTGNSVPINGTTVHFYRAYIVFSKLQLDEALTGTAARPNDRPVIAILGGRSLGSAKEKCNYGFELREDCVRSLYVVAPFAMTVLSPPYGDMTAKEAGGHRLVTRIYDQVHAIITARYNDFHDRGLYYPSIPSTPVEAADEKNAIVYGNFTFQSRCFYQHDADPVI